MPTIRAAALTDIGRVRRENEDRFVCDKRGLLFGVADGVGGLPGGGEAAALAIDEIMRGIATLRADEDANLALVLQRANSAVAQLGLKLSPAMGIGTTVTIGLVRNGTMKLAHVGDSRCYMVHGREFVRLTEDHSVENEARLRRARGELVHFHEANRQALTRCIGQPGRVEVDMISRPLAAGDRYLFCTDGVTRMIDERELGSVVQKHTAPEPALHEIITTAVTRGGPDNATGVLVFIDSV